jgi:hypothetical protein
MRTAPAWLVVVLLVLAVVLLGGLGYTNYRFSVAAPGGNDFLARWVGARYWLVEGINPYDSQVDLATQRFIYGRPADRSRGEDVAHFVYPLPSMVFFAPFGLLPYTLARAIWMTLLEIALPLLVLIGIRLARWKPPLWLVALLMLFSVVWYFGFRSVVLGQFAVFEAVLLSGALLAIQRRRDVLAGVLLALAIAKPQMTFLIVPFIAIWAIPARRWALLGSILVSHVVLIGVFLVAMPDWPLLWIRQALDYPTYTETISPVAIIANGIPRASGWITAVVTGLLVLYCLVEWGMALGKDDRRFQWVAQMTFVITNLIAFRTATTNFVVMLPGLCLVFGLCMWRWGKRTVPAIVSLMVLLFAGPWLLFVRTVHGDLESLAMYPPLPLLAFFLLVWVRWWAVREPLLPLEVSKPAG